MYTAYIFIIKSNMSTNSLYSALLGAAISHDVTSEIMFQALRQSKQQMDEERAFRQAAVDNLKKVIKLLR